jgi:hypothetical protein
MIKTFIPFATITLALSGCSATQITTDATAISGGINAIATAASSPGATQAAANLKAGAVALLCGVNDVAAIASQVEAQISAGNALIKDTQDIYVASSTICGALGGSVISPSVVVSATALTSTKGL